MKAQLTQESKDAIIEALKLKLAKNSPTDTDWELWFESAIAEVESFPVSDGWKQDSSNTWIPVEERLPEERVPVLVRMSYWKFDVCYRLAETFVQDVRPQHSNGGVTHWKPLPLPPVTK